MKPLTRMRRRIPMLKTWLEPSKSRESEARPLLKPKRTRTKKTGRSRKKMPKSEKRKLKTKLPKVKGNDEGNH